MILKQSHKYQGNLHKFDFEVNSKEECNFFISSDWHWDNVKCNRELLKSHLDKAIEIGAFIVVTGDMLCLMQGKYDKRSSKSAVRPEHNATNYLDVVINDCANFLRPYAKNILLISEGNHETSVSERHETRVLERLVERVNTLEGTNIQLGNYTGYYKLSFNYKGSKKTLNVGYSHGNWGGVITKGTLSVMRYSAIMPDCELMFSGHTHDGWIMAQPRLRIGSQNNKVIVQNQMHVKTGTYKEEFAEGKGWAVERIAVPKYLGGCFVRVTYNQHKDLEFELNLTN
jgi:predicted phosphodiesterase